LLGYKLDGSGLELCSMVVLVLHILDFLVLLPGSQSLSYCTSEWSTFVSAFGDFLLFSFRVMAVVLVYQHGDFLTITHTIV
jgi:hypothetical protein